MTLVMLARGVEAKSNAITIRVMCAKTRTTKSHPKLNNPIVPMYFAPALASCVKFQLGWGYCILTAFIGFSYFCIFPATLPHFILSSCDFAAFLLVARKPSHVGIYICVCVCVYMCMCFVALFCTHAGSVLRNLRSWVTKRCFGIQKWGKDTKPKLWNTLWIKSVLMFVYPTTWAESII